MNQRDSELIDASEIFKKHREFLDSLYEKTGHCGKSYRKKFKAECKSITDEAKLLTKINSEKSTIRRLMENWNGIEEKQILELKRWYSELDKILVNHPKSKIPWYENKEIIKQICQKCLCSISEERILRSKNQIPRYCDSCKNKSAANRSKRWREKNPDADLKAKLKYLRDITKK